MTEDDLSLRQSDQDASDMARTDTHNGDDGAPVAGPSGSQTPSSIRRIGKSSYKGKEKMVSDVAVTGELARSSDDPAKELRDLFKRSSSGLSARTMPDTPLDELSGRLEGMEPGVGFALIDQSLQASPRCEDRDGI